MNNPAGTYLLKDNNGTSKVNNKDTGATFVDVLVSLLLTLSKITNILRRIDKTLVFCTCKKTPKKERS